MKKITLLSIIVALISIGQIVPQEIIFEDNFESYTVGTFPSSNWYLRYNGSGTANQIVVDNQYVSPTQSLLLECAPNWAATADVQLSQTPSIIYCEGYIKSEHEFGGPDFGFQNPDIGPWGTAYASVGVGKNGSITCNGQVLQNCEANKWYHVKIKYDSHSDVCDVWIDHVLKGQDISCSTNGEYTILRLSTHNSSTTVKGWYDDVKVYTTPPIDLDNGLVAYYPFNGNANDESENDNNGDVYGATLSTDRFGDADKAYTFDGVEDYISVDDHETLRPASLTISCFIKFEPPYHYNIQNIVTKNLGDFTYESYTIFCNSNVVQSLICDSSGYGNYLNYPLIPDSNWHHLIFTFDDSTNIEKIYINGEFVIQAIETKSIAFDDNPLYISGELESMIPSYFFKGKIDDVHIYNRALNNFEVKALYHEGGWKIKPSFLRELNNQVACKNDSIAFEAIPEGMPLQYQWQKDSIDIPGATDSVFIIPNVQSEDEGEYRCIVTNDYGADTSKSASLSIEFEIPTVIVGHTSVSEYQIVLYSVSLEEGHNYEFIVEGGNIIDESENTISVHWSAAGQGYIHLIEQSELGCYADTNTLNVTIGSLGFEEYETINLSISPNPFTTSTTIEYELQEPATVHITIYNHLGKQIELIRQNQPAGKQQFIWNAKDLPSGMYFCVLRTDFGTQTMKMIKMK